MATLNKARFTINGEASEDEDGNRGLDVEPEDVLTIQLEANPAMGVSSVIYSINNPADPESPVCSLNSTDQEFTESGAATIALTNPNQAVTLTIDAATEISSYVLRAEAIAPEGKYTFERLIAVRSNGLRMTVPGETTEYGQRGWSDAINELTLAVATGGGGGGGSLPAQAANTVLGNSTSGSAVPSANPPQAFEFSNATSGAGNIRGKVAPQGFGAITSLTTASNVNVDIALSENGTYQFSILIRARMATAGTRLTKALMLVGNRVSGTFTIEGNEVPVDLGDGTGLSVTVSATGGNLRVNIANATGETIDGRVHVGWFVEDLL